MRRLLSLLPALAVLPAAAHAQAVATSRALWQQVTAQVTQIAEEVPESLYAFKPTPEVRSFGQLFGHIAGAQYLMCAAALGDPPPEEDAVERATTTKAGLVEALKASSAYCDKAYAQSDAASGGMTRLFGEERTRLYALGMNAIHNGEHYGNLVTYLRMNGVVPPASRPRQ